MLYHRSIFTFLLPSQLSNRDVAALTFVTPLPLKSVVTFICFLHHIDSVLSSVVRAPATVAVYPGQSRPLVYAILLMLYCLLFSPGLVY